MIFCIHAAASDSKEKWSKCEQLEIDQLPFCDGIMGPNGTNNPEDFAKCNLLAAEARKKLEKKLKADRQKVFCEEVNDQYTICNGVRYVRDTAIKDSIKRDVKKIEEHIDSGKSSSDTSAVSK